MRPRRALSPLLATILLVAFSVALATLVMSWLMGGEEAPVPVEACDAVRLEAQAVPQGSSICYDMQRQHLVFVVKNVGDDPIPKLLLSIVDSQLNVEEREITAELTGAGRFEVPYSTIAPQGLSVTITPALAREGSRVLCSGQEIEQVSVPLC